MNLSTSSFKAVFGIVLAALVIYTFSLRFIPFDLGTGTSQFQENKIKLEHFVFNPEKCETLIAGSSLSYHLRNEYFDGTYCNLGFAGSSAVTALEVVKIRSEKTVKSVLVEINVLRGMEKDLIQLSHGPHFWLSQIFPFSQNRYQPVTVFINFLRTLIPYVPPQSTPEQFKIFLDSQAKDYSEVDEVFLRGFENNFSLLKEQIQIIEAAGVKVQLIELPMHPAILNSVKHQFIKKQFQEAFPNKNIWTDSREYTTNDALHLTVDSAIQFSKFLREQRR